MLRKLILITVISSFIAAPALADPSIGDVSYIKLQTRSWIYETANSYDEGGEFKATVLQNCENGINYDDLSIPVGGSFLTFCLESDELISGSDNYLWAVVNTSAVRGGNQAGDGSYAGGNPLYTGSNPTGPPNYDSKGQLNYGDPLDPRTAYLFTQFAEGALSNYNFTGTVAQRKDSAKKLTVAIGFIENEFSPLGKPEDAQAQAWITEAQNAIDNGLWSGIGNVRILNTYSTYNCSTGKVSGLKQDVLVYVPVPGAVLLGMLGLSVAGIKLRKHA